MSIRYIQEKETATQIQMKFKKDEKVKKRKQENGKRGKENNRE